MTDIGKTSQPRYEYIRALLSQRLTGGSVVELGAAPGDQTVALARAGYDCTAVDIGVASDAWGDADEGRMVKLFADNGVDYVEWNLEEYPYPLDDDHFDAAILTEVYEHLREYPIRTLEESFRILKPGGHLFLTTPNAAYLGSRLKLLAGKSPATPLPDWIAGIPLARHAREYTFDEMEQLLRRVGFAIDVCETHHFYRNEGSGPRKIAKQALEVAGRYRRTLGPSIVIVASKRRD